MSDSTTDPRDLLRHTRELRTKSRGLADRGAWLPALALALLPLLSVALYRYPTMATYSVAEYPFWAGLPHQQRNPTVSYLFWLLGLPATFAVIGAWYQQRQHREGIKVAWVLPAVTGLVALVVMLALIAAPSGQSAPIGVGHPRWAGLLTPLLAVGLAAILHGLLTRRLGIALSGVWLAALAWQFCATGQIGGLLGWQSWLLAGGSGQALGGQLTLLGLDRPAPALIFMSAPLLITGLLGAVRSHRAAKGES